MIEPFTKRAPPAFQEYASDILSNRNFRSASLSEKGLIHLLRCELWVNKSLPSNLDDLANYLYLNLDELKGTYTNRVSSFFAIQNNELICPELDAYREKLKVRWEKQSKGGKNGGKKTQENIRTKKTLPEPNLKLLSREDKIREEEKTVGQSKDISATKVYIEEHAEWLKDFEGNSDVINNSYYKAKNGYI